MQRWGALGSCGGKDSVPEQFCFVRIVAAPMVAEGIGAHLVAEHGAPALAKRHLCFDGAPARRDPGELTAELAAATDERAVEALLPS